MGQCSSERRPTATQSESERLALRAHTALTDRRAVEPVMLDMREVTVVTDFFLICHGTSGVHIRGLAEAVTDALKEEKRRPLAVEGTRDGGWILIDFGEFIVHIFDEEQREFYDLERLWSDAPTVPIAEEDA